MGSKGSAPKAPDYVGAANAQAEASKEVTNIQNFANRPTINTPFGTESWNSQASIDPATGQRVTSWTQNTTLAPGLQAALDAQVGTQLGRSNLANDFMGRVANEYSTPFDWQGLPQMAQMNGAPSLNTGMADYAQGLNTGVNSRSGGISGGFNFGGPQMGMNPMVGNIAQQTGQTQLQRNFDPMMGLNYSTGSTPINAQFNDMQGGLQRGVQDYGLNTQFGSGAGNIQSGVQDYGLDTQFGSGVNDIQRGVQNYGLNAQFDPMQGGLARNVQQQNIQRSLNTGDNPALPQFDSGYRDTVAQSLIERMMPVHDRQRNEIETQLANSGYTVGSEGYTRALADMQGRQAAERYNALDTAGNEAQRLYGMQMGSRQQAFNEDMGMGQFANSAANQAFQQSLGANQFQNQATSQAYQQAMNAQQAGNQALGQQFNQNLQQGQFGNQAAAQAYQQAMGAQQAGNQALGQQFGQGLQAAQFGNQAEGQRFQQEMNAQQAGNQALGQQFQQGVTAGQFGNQATAQAYQQALAAQQAGNQAQGQRFQQDLAANQFGNQAMGQAFQQNMAAGQAGNQAAGQEFQQGSSANQFQNQAANQIFQQMLGASQFGNQAQQQLFGQNMGMADLSNRANAQAFGQDLQAAQFGNQALGQAAALDQSRMGAMNQAMGQQFGMNQQLANQQNQLRQQAIAEQMQRRGMSLNEMNALLSGQQVGMPQMPNFNQAQRSETPDILGATQMGYDAQLGAYNAKQAGASNMMGGLFSLGGAALSNPFMFSDRRLKRGLKRVGTHAIGVGIYDYTMLGFPQRGVIAQEVQKVRPDLVARHASGYLTVNYSEL